MNKLEEIVRIFTLSLGSLVEGIAAVIVFLAIIRALVVYTRNVVSTEQAIDKAYIRLTLGKSLAVVLEFLLAADILRTAVAPTWNDIGKLAAIAALRTLLNYFLEKELNRSELQS
jgi:uncharacterized membrane protein